ncbi:hypothetical protein TELCIR_07661 [Teladorsagia circumcincta]|uniref:C-type lectin domain-containing protein n=1 Tax=Teladorsagia circumcincta TaxID=45464 RepID=A0A2G9UJR0_TELCI|nr:hypothetical protein TELCIR_07661 [Teladorsagia circumcincta]
MDRESAQRACIEKGASLFVADSEEEKWLITPFSSIANGWSILATCAAFYNTESYHTSAYLYFYTCSTLYHSICERNMTLIPF